MIVPLGPKQCLAYYLPVVNGHDEGLAEAQKRSEKIVHPFLTSHNSKIELYLAIFNQFGVYIG